MDVRIGISLPGDVEMPRPIYNPFETACALLAVLHPSDPRRPLGGPATAPAGRAGGDARALCRGDAARQADGQPNVQPVSVPRRVPDMVNHGLVEPHHCGSAPSSAPPPPPRSRQWRVLRGGLLAPARGNVLRVSMQVHVAAAVSEGVE